MTTDVPAEVRLTDLLGCSDARPRVLDPASGSRMMWFDRGHPDVVFGDKRRETVTVTDRSHGRADGTRTLTVDPDLLMDFRALPFEDGTFRLVAFDPPHLVRAGPRSWLAAKYGKLGQDWRDEKAANSGGPSLTSSSAQPSSLAQASACAAEAAPEAFDEESHLRVCGDRC